VSWWEWGNFGPGTSEVVQASKDGGSTWNAISSASFSFQSWHRVAVVLDASYAVSNFQIRFHFTVGNYPNTYAGWYIDDVCVAPGGLGSLSGRLRASNAGYEASGVTSWAWARFPPTSMA